jgi:predicted  nucleic acid-binding Zn-ribbon protein
MNHLEVLIQKREASLEKKNKDIEAKLEVEKEKLLQKLVESETTVKKLEQTSLSLTQELVELKTKNKTIALLQSGIAEFESAKEETWGKFEFEREPSEEFGRNQRKVEQRSKGVAG